MKHRAIVLSVLVGTFSSFTLGVWAKRTEKWTLEFAHERPSFIVIRDPIMGESVYWYFTYEVSNHTGGDRMFSPNIVIETDAEINYHASMYPDAEEAIKRELNNEALLNVHEIRGVIKAGESKQGIAVFQTIDATIDTFVIWISGLSNVFEGNPSNPDAVKRKRLRIEYNRQGDEFSRHLDVLRLIKQDWAMR